MCNRNDLLNKPTRNYFVVRSVLHVFSNDFYQTVVFAIFNYLMSVG
jgi:hypothetical protein